jgi:hypothetical protein
MFVRSEVEEPRFGFSIRNLGNIIRVHRLLGTNHPLRHSRRANHLVSLARLEFAFAASSRSVVIRSAVR